MRINYEIPDDVHRQAKAAAALGGVTLRDFIIDAIAQAVREGTHPPATDG